jgi:hypothetical protein
MDAAAALVAIVIWFIALYYVIRAAVRDAIVTAASMRKTGLGRGTRRETD